MNIFLVFYIFLFKKAPSEALPALITKIQSINPNAKYKVEDILDYKYINDKIKYLIK